jgi:hypothetical protein
MNIKIGEYNQLKIVRLTAIGVYLDDGQDGVLVPKRFVPREVKVGEELNVFIYHDGEGRVIATTQHPLGILGDIVKLRAVSISPHGAFLDMGLMKDLFVPKSQQIQKMIPHGNYLIKIYLDEMTGRLAGTERIDAFLSNEELTVGHLQMVDLIVYRKTDIGYLMIINNRHTGVLHFNDVYRPVGIGDHFKGYIKNILPDNKLDVAIGKAGYERVDEESEKIMNLLGQHHGFLPYHDKSSPEDIYRIFGMSKKTFKMALGRLYKNKKVLILDNGFQEAEE